MNMIQMPLETAASAAHYPNYYETQGLVYNYGIPTYSMLQGSYELSRDCEMGAASESPRSNGYNAGIVLNEDIPSLHLPPSLPMVAQPSSSVLLTAHSGTQHDLIDHLTNLHISDTQTTMTKGSGPERRKKTGHRVAFVAYMKPSAEERRSSIRKRLASPPAPVPFSVNKSKARVRIEEPKPRAVSSPPQFGVEAASVHTRDRPPTLGTETQRPPTSGRSSYPPRPPTPGPSSYCPPRPPTPGRQAVLIHAPNPASVPVPVFFDLAMPEPDKQAIPKIKIAGGKSVAYMCLQFANQCRTGEEDARGNEKREREVDGGRRAMRQGRTAAYKWEEGASVSARMERLKRRMGEEGEREERRKGSRERTVREMSRMVGASAFRHFSTASTHSPESQYDEFFNHTSSRWIHDEARQLSLRYRRFDVDALKETAAIAGGASAVVNMVKLAEGSYNKVFLLSLDNGKDVIARIPTSLAGPPHIVTASEVATSDYVRSRLGLPVPRILAWCADASSTPVNSEYIIMERAEGVELGSVWETLTSDMKNIVVRKWVDIENLLMTPISGIRVYILSRRCQSYDVARSIHCGHPDERQSMEIDRGPWSDCRSTIMAICNCERSWIEKYAVAKPNPGPFDSPMHIQQPSLHLSLLDQYAAVAPYLIPPEPALSRPTLWHTDLHSGNIFVSKEGLAEGKINISAVIDWQHASISPLYLQACVPRFIEYRNPMSLPPGFQSVLLPDDFDTLETETQTAIAAAVEAANRHQLYKAVSSAHNPEYYRALSFQTRELAVPPVLFSGSTWPRGFMLLREWLIRIFVHWNVLGHVGVPCPIQFSDAEMNAHRTDADEWQELQDGLVLVRDHIGIEKDGRVSNEAYDDAIARNEALKNEYIEIMGGEERDWPYRP
ncbi:hypothetical protein EW146_g8881 [Bondarzewia mesenterica]|uniref:Aminoglycoside phosphotransferase domain-containing protein n=1 Tax=Bondarzewia mesenterica TaxID=1095465 RepID=A0A4S4LB50_9AGAM|nr:hypothetical protein EW146_g8881 [Bondarzewia mesenterica]